MSFLIVFLGGGVGAAIRHGVNLLVSLMISAHFPLGTLFINAFGSFLMGAIVGYMAFRGDVSQSWRLFLATGVLGGFTTFSTFSLETVLLFERGEQLNAALYVMASVGLGVAGFFGGVALLRHFPS